MSEGGWGSSVRWKEQNKQKQELQETQVQSLGWEDPLEDEMATHSSILAWKISWTEEPGGVYGPWGCKESDGTKHTVQGGKDQPRASEWGCVWRVESLVWKEG